MKRLCFVALCSVLALMASNAGAASILSAPFSFGYGFNNLNSDGGSWNTNETAGANTSTTLGDFTFTPTVNGGHNSTTGPQFNGRILGNGGAHYGAYGLLFTLNITGTYTGPTPGDAAADPDYQIKLHITQLSMFGATFGGAEILNFAESTLGHEASQPPQGVAGGNLTQAATYAQVVWDPADFFSAIDTVSQGRSFFLQSSDLGNVNLDGLEVFGFVELSYTAIPEPTGFSLVGMAFCGLAAWRRKVKA
jgi:hypothetical protein